MSPINHLKSIRHEMWGRNAPKIRELDTICGMDYFDCLHVCLASLEVHCANLIDGWIAWYEPIPPRHLTREERKISKST